jgi:ribosomal protein S18 acetylase RimI-like enzyme
MEMTLLNGKKVSSSAITMRTASIEDVDALVSLGRETFIETFAGSNTESDMSLYLEKAFNEQVVSAELQDKTNTFFIAEIDGIPVAYAKVSRSTPPEQLKSCKPVELSRLYAKSAVIGKGLGQALMQKCIEHARTNGYDVIWLGVWEHNQRALSFYNKFGFERFSEHIFVLGNDAQTDLLLKKQL